MPEPKKLYRSTTERLIGGVGGGLAERLGVDPTVVRLLLVAALFFNWLVGVLYLAMWYLLPEEDTFTLTG